MIHRPLLCAPLLCAAVFVPLAILSIPGWAGAQDAGLAPAPDSLNRVTACRGLAESAARLACYDAAVAAFDSARLQGDVVVVDRAQVTAARRQMFGFSVPALPSVFGAEPMEALETTLVSASEMGDGNWLFTLEDGSIWRQTDGERMRFANRAGEPVRVRNGALGSFRLTVGRSRAARVRRQ